MKVTETRDAIPSAKALCKTFVRRAVVLTCSLVVAVCAPAMADQSDLDIEAEFIACPSPCVAVPGAEGEFDYQAEFLSDGITVKGVKFRATVTIPVSNVLGITASNAGAAGLVVIDLTRPNPANQLAETYARCAMELKKVRTGALIYALSLSGKLKRGQFVEGKKTRGFCDIDLGTSNTQFGIPTMRHGDVAFVAANGADILASPFPDSCEGCWDY